MKKIYSITSCLIFCLTWCALAISAQAPTWQWAKSAGGSYVDRAYSVAVDGSGNSYVTGFFCSPSLTFGSTTLTNVSTLGKADLFLVKYDPSGNVLWAKSAGGAKDEYAYSVAVDASGNSYVTGTFQSLTMTFGSILLTNVDNSGNTTDIFLAKYDANGNVLWAKSVGSLGWDFDQSVAVDASGNSYITGNFQGSAITFGSTTLTNTSATYGQFLAKYDPSGNELWAKSAQGNYYFQANSVYVDGAGNSCVTGYFGNAVTFGSITLTTIGNDDLFLVKYDPLGNVLWAKSAGGLYNDHANFVAFDGAGNCYVTGWFGSPTLTFGSSTLTNANNPQEDPFLMKYDASGNELWAKSATGIYSDISNSIAVDAAGNCFIAGFFESPTIAFGNITLTNINVNNLNSEDVFLAKYDASGNELWAKSTGGAGRDVASSVAIDALGDGYIAGYFELNMIVGSDSLVENIAKVSDIFVAKIGKDIDGIYTDENFDSGISIFPNPSSGVFHLEISNGNFSKSQIEIYDALGQIVFKSEIENAQAEIDLSGNAKGVYFYRIFNGAQIIGSGKISVE